MAFTYITTDGGVLTAKDFGAFVNLFVPDSVAVGCEFNYSEGNITMSSGQLVVCGRIVKNVGSISWSVPSSATKCYIVATITGQDFTTEVVTSVSDLVKEDINDDGSEYQVVLAEADISDGVVTGLTKTLPKYSKFGGVFYGTTEEPASTNYPDGTLYIQYEE